MYTQLQGLQEEVLSTLTSLLTFNQKDCMSALPGSSVNLCDKSKLGVGGGEDLVTAKS